MKEQLICFETAKLAKEKGFKELCFHYYDNKEELQEPYLENGSSTDVDFRVDLEDLLEQHNSVYHNTYSAPTQYLLQKWLREEHNILVLIKHDNIFPNHFVCVVKQKNKNMKWSTKYKSSINAIYEEALEQGLYEALKLI